MQRDDILLETGTNELEIAEFGIYLKGEENKLQSFGINVAKIREIIKLPKYIEMPNSNRFIVGAFNLRENVIPLIDLANWLDEKSDGIDLDKCFVIVTEFNKSNFGFIIHAIKAIHRLSWKKVLPPMKVKSSAQDSITGIVNFDDRIVMMLDFEKIVADINPESSLSIKTDSEIINDVQKIGNRMPKVLVAEDSGIVCDLLVKVLEQGGFEVASVNNGMLAWDYINALSDEAIKNGKTINDELDILIADIEMPQMDGHSLCRKVKENPSLNTLPVVLFSSLIYEEIKRKGELIGADAQISKPEIGNLISIIRGILKDKANSGSKAKKRGKDGKSS